jgi:hypothetical protein
LNFENALGISIEALPDYQPVNAPCALATGRRLPSEHSVDPTMNTAPIRGGQLSASIGEQFCEALRRQRK